MWFNLDKIFSLYQRSHSWEGATSGVSRPYVMTCWKCTWSSDTTEHRPHRYNLINNNNHSHHPNWSIKEKIIKGGCGEGDAKASSVVYQFIRKVLLCHITKVEQVTYFLLSKCINFVRYNLYFSGPVEVGHRELYFNSVVHWMNSVGLYSRLWTGHA